MNLTPLENIKGDLMGSMCHPCVPIEPEDNEHEPRGVRGPDM